MDFRIEYNDNADITKNGIADVYTDESLRLLINSSGVMSLRSRDFVKGVISYARNKDNRVVGISGLRGTGKTTGFLQAIYKLGYNKCVYMVINPNTDVTCRDIYNLVMGELSSYRYIFIDEITRVKDFILQSSILYDSITLPTNKKLFIGGTESLSLVMSYIKGLYHRMVLTSVTFINYGEAKRTTGVSLQEYIRMGGLYKADIFSDINGLYNYVSTSVLDNIVGTMRRNANIIPILSGVSDSKLMRVIFMVLYTVTFSKLRYSLNLKRMIDLFDLRGSLYSFIDTDDLIKRRFGIADKDLISDGEFSAVLQILMQIGLVIRLENICKAGEYEYFIVNQCMTNVLLRDLAKVIQESISDNTQLADDDNLNSYILRSSVVAHALQLASKRGIGVYFYRDTDGEEIDLVFELESYDDFGDMTLRYYLYEIKMTGNIDTAITETKWLNDNKVSSYFSSRGEIARGTALKSASDFLINMYKYII